MHTTRLQKKYTWALSLQASKMRPQYGYRVQFRSVYRGPCLGWFCSWPNQLYTRLVPDATFSQECKGLASSEVWMMRIITWLQYAALSWYKVRLLKNICRMRISHSSRAEQVAIKSIRRWDQVDVYAPGARTSMYIRACGHVLKRALLRGLDAALCRGNKPALAQRIGKRGALIASTNGKYK